MEYLDFQRKNLAGIIIKEFNEGTLTLMTLAIAAEQTAADNLTFFRIKFFINKSTGYPVLKLMAP